MTIKIIMVWSDGRTEGKNARVSKKAEKQFDINTLTAS